MEANLNSFRVLLTLLVLKLRPLCGTAATSHDTNDANVTDGTDREARDWKEVEAIVQSPDGDTAAFNAPDKEQSHNLY